MEKILTIIIPSYNMEQYLESCCKSLLVSKKYLDYIEVLIINDGSKDNTSLIGHKMHEQYPGTFFVIDKENGNYGSCINTGLKIAHGKYVKILDADDTFLTNNFEEYLNILINNDVDLILSDFDEVDPDGNLIVRINYPFKENTISSVDIFPNDIVNNFAMHAVTYKVENLKKLSYFQTEGISYTDQEWIFLPMANAKKFIYYNKTLYLYLIGRQGQTISKEASIKNIGQGLTIATKIINDYISHENEITIESKNYIINKLYERCSTQYRQFIIEYKKIVDFNRLIEFDSILKNQLPQIYEKLNNLKDFTSFLYVKEWRKNFTNKTIRFKLFYFNRFLYCCIKNIIKSFKK